MESLKDLQAQLNTLQLKIAEAEQSEKADAIAKAKELIVQHGLTSADLFGHGKTARKKVLPKGDGKKVAAKYRDPATGNTWSGRGLEPKWLAGKDRSKFLIA